MTEKRRGRVLVVDDDRVASDVIVKTLLPRGLDVSVAASPDRGVEKAREDTPDLVFVSLFFPDSNGLKVSKRIHALHGLERVPVVMLVSYKGDLDPKYTSTIGIVDVLVKPLKPAEILSKTIAVFGKEALSETDTEPVSPPPEEDLSVEKEGPVGTDERLSILQTEKDAARLQDISPEDGLGAEGMEDRTESDESEEFLKEEASEEAAPSGESPQDEGTGERFPEEAGQGPGIPPPLEEEMPFAKGPREFLGGKKLVAVSVLCAALVLGIGAFGVKKILSKAEKAAQSRQAPAGQEVVRESAGGPVVSGESKGKETDKGVSAKTEEHRTEETVGEKKGVSAAAEVSRIVSPPPPKGAGKGGRKEADPVTRKGYGFSVQVGAFGSEKNALSLAEELKKKGYDSFVENDGGRPLSRVMVGRFPDAKKASELAKELREEGLKTIVRRGKG
jgi:CheY-like chemotaxis protein